MDDLGVPLFLETPIYLQYFYKSLGNHFPKKSGVQSQQVMKCNQILLQTYYKLLPVSAFQNKYHLLDHGNLRVHPPCHVYPQETAGLIKGLWSPPSSPSKVSSLTRWLIYRKLLAPVPAYAVGPPSQNLWHSLREETSAHGDCANGRLGRFNFVTLTKYSWLVICHPSENNVRKSNLGIIDCISPQNFGG